MSGDGDLEYRRKQSPLCRAVCVALSGSYVSRALTLLVPLRGQGSASCH